MRGWWTGAGQPALRRALGAALDGCGALRRHQRLRNEPRAARRRITIATRSSRRSTRTSRTTSSSSEQLAGDALGADAATGFLVAGPYDIVKSPDINLTLMQRQDELADMVNTTGTAFLGLTMGCARCHNHKFDPILQKDYYAMQAVFAGVNHGERPLRKKAGRDHGSGAGEGRSRTKPRSRRRWKSLRKRPAAMSAPAATLRPPVNARLTRKRSRRWRRVPCGSRSRRRSAAEPCLDELEIYDEAGKNVALASTGAKPSASGTLPGHAIHKLEHINDGQTGNDRSWIADTAGQGWVQIDLPARQPHPAHRLGPRPRRSNSRTAWRRSTDRSRASEPGKWTTSRVRTTAQPFMATKRIRMPSLRKLSGADAAAARQLQTELAERERGSQTLGGTQTAWVGHFTQPEKTHRLYRGEPMQKREVVAPGCARGPRHARAWPWTNPSSSAA